MSYALLYRWKLRRGREEEFARVWQELTEELRLRGEFLGANLHQANDGSFWSYARWISEDAKNRCFAHDSPCLEDVLRRMQGCIEHRFDEIPLTVHASKLVEKCKAPVPTLHSARLCLRPLVMGDAEAVFPALHDAENMRYWSRGPLDTLQACREYISWNVYASDVDCFAITREHASEHALGWVVLMYRNTKEAEIGYILRRDAQGVGVATEAAKRVLRYGFEEKGLRRISADVDPDNLTSIVMLEKLGFAKEGHLRATYETHIGVRDSLIFALVAASTQTV